MDDGLLLNFATDEPAPTRKAKLSGKIVGGSWKERRKAQLASQGRVGSRKKTIDLAKRLETTPSVPTTEDAEARKVRALANDRKRGGPKEFKGPSSKQMRLAEKNGETIAPTDSYVSSLFTSNPSLTNEVAEEAFTELAPSNAPLTDATTFEGLGIEGQLLKHLEALRFTNPTKIQRAVLPRLLERETDLFVQAQTGSGKTLAFALPIFQKLMTVKDLDRQSGVFALILAPTRELATQIYSVLETLSRCCNRIVPGIVIGGEKKKSEKARIRKGVNILVATPGRLLDHIENTQNMDLANIRWVVLDEGDKLMELGFEETITKILTKITNTSAISATTRIYPTLPKQRINVLCSATIKDNVQKLGEISLQDAEMVSAALVGDESEQISAPGQLLQQILVVPPKLRLVSLGSVLKNITRNENQFTRTMVFFSCSDSVDFHFATFTKDGKKLLKRKIPEEDDEKVTEIAQGGDDDSTALTAPLLSENTYVYKLHGSLSQQVRTSTLAAFTKASEGKHTVLFCTDVAARGLDLPDISTVIEYDPPFAIEDHLHRVGRTARAGNNGKSVLFLLPGTEEQYADRISSYHPAGLQHISFESVLVDGFGKKWEVDATTWHLNVERWLLEDTTAHDKAVQGFTSHVRAYATHLGSERDVFNVRTLHLGHLAKAFGLRETPKRLGGAGLKKGDGKGESKKTGKEDARTKMLRMAKMNVKSASSEFNFM
ncbi:hypothetical protein BABINDRAFT_162376 [Babjeviella inositovora NRRL Y-12698]|uniref:ATP-dependent RNA helicase n=1 Tax=Babjeviella inositovora NRRL Y-12698 TaxID=984486 RepID=A0A1E3QLV5_9ASCO|nr:uncharacterized protein BABINDRAFT_162376 [Babjeviella inositovora NRRL Y-12698]ODQ78673.1 hypothetical protein BABINDRAFT_162376 [Babjeviella inositovora NRRL Y-12698]